METINKLLKDLAIDLANERTVISSNEAFRTHLNYVWFMEDITRNLKIQHKIDIRKEIKQTKKGEDLLNKKINLIKLIIKNLNGEHKIIKNNIEFSEICVPWVAVKAYYLIFNSMLILEYLITCDVNSFKAGHKAILERFKNNVKSKIFSFNDGFFYRIVPYEEIKKWKLPLGHNLKLPQNIDPEIRFKGILRKLFDYALVDFSRNKHNLKDRRKFIQNASLNICEFFYWYRIKSNYRDLEFLDKDIHMVDFFRFYHSYFNALKNFYVALKELINNLSFRRLNRKIL